MATFSKALHCIIGDQRTLQNRSRIRPGDHPEKEVSAGGANAEAAPSLSPKRRGEIRLLCGWVHLYHRRDRPHRRPHHWCTWVQGEGWEPPMRPAQVRWLEWANISVRRIGERSSLPIVSSRVPRWGGACGFGMSTGQPVRQAPRDRGRERVRHVREFKRCSDDSQTQIRGKHWWASSGPVRLRRHDGPPASVQAVAKWLRLAATRGRTLTMAKVNLRRGGRR